MNQKSDIELERAKVTKITRTLLRLKYSLEFDKALNSILPAQLEEFDAGLQTGELKVVNKKLLEELLEV